MSHLEFSFPRFLHTLRYCWQTQMRLPYMVMLGLLPIGFLFLTSYSEDTPYICFATLYFVCGLLYTGLSFYELENPVTGRQFLALPASYIEKWLAKWLLAFVVFPLLLAAFYAVAITIFNFFSERILVVRYHIFDHRQDDYYVALFFFTLAQPLFFTAGLAWKRYSLFKSFAVGIVGLFVMLFVLSTFRTSAQHDTGYMLINLVNLPFGMQHPSPTVAAYQSVFWMIGFYIPSLLFLMASFFLFKQKEI